MPVLFAGLHHCLAFLLVAILFAESLLLRMELTLESAKKIQRLDLGYGVLAMLLLVVGGMRAVYFEKGWAYYRHSPWFHVKLTLFILVALLSIYPTFQFLKWRRMTASGAVPQPSAQQMRWMRLAMAAQAAGIVLIVFAAAAMARGFTFA